jgi:hypothetical protein
MRLASSFAETVQKRARRDREFRAGLLRETIDALRCGEIEVAKILLRDYLAAIQK